MSSLKEKTALQPGPAAGHKCSRAIVMFVSFEMSAMECPCKIHSCHCLPVNMIKNAGYINPFALVSIPHGVWLLLDLCDFDVIGTLGWIVCLPTYVYVSELGTVNQKSQKKGKLSSLVSTKFGLFHHVCSVELGETVADPFVGGGKPCHFRWM